MKAPAKRNLNEGLSTLVFCFSMFAATFFSLGCTSNNGQVGDRVVLVVNGREVTAKGLADRVVVQLKQYDALHVRDPGNVKRIKEETIRNLIVEMITQSYAERAKINVDEKELAKKVTEVRAQFPDDFAFRRALADQNVSFDDWREGLRISLLQRKVAEKIQSTVTPPSEQELKDSYEASKKNLQRPARIRLRQIVLEKEEDAQHIVDELANGTDLGVLAKKFSVAPEAAVGGDTGWIYKGTLDIFDQAFKMPLHQRSKILKSPYGYHIYEVLQKEPEGQLSFQEARAKIRAQLLEQREHRAYAAWLEEQVRKSSVKRNDALIDAMSVSTREK